MTSVNGLVERLRVLSSLPQFQQLTSKSLYADAPEQAADTIESLLLQIEGLREALKLARVAALSFNTRLSPNEVEQVDLVLEQSQ